MKIAFIIPILLTNILANEQPQQDTSQAWRNAYNSLFLGRQIYRQSITEKTDEVDLALKAMTSRLKSNFKTLVKFKELKHLEIKFSSKDLSKKKQIQFRLLMNNLSAQYGHPMTSEMMDLGTNYIIKNGRNPPEKVIIQTHLPIREHNQLKNILTEVENKLIEIKPVQPKLSKDSSPQILWITISHQIQEYVDIIGTIANERGAADPSLIFTRLNALDKTFETMTEANILIKKTYPISFEDLPKHVQDKLNSIADGINTIYGVQLSKEMMGCGSLESVRSLDPQYKLDQFNLYLPEEQLLKISKFIDQEINNASQKTK